MVTKQEIFDKCGKDIILLGKTINPKAYYRPTPKFHTQLARLLSDTSIRQASIEAPRGAAKSTLCVNEVLRHCIYDEGDKVVVIQSKTRKEALRRITKIKNTLSHNHAFIELYGYFGIKISDTWREDEIRVRTPYGYWTIVSVGTGQPLRGVLEDDTRITLYYFDDPQDEDNCVTDDQMDKAFDKMLGSLQGLDMRNGRIRVVGTPLDFKCIVVRLRNAPGWTTLHFKNHQDDGTLLWPEMHSQKFLDEKKEELKSFGKLSKYYSEYECEIVGDEDQLFRPDDMRYWDGDLLIRGDETFIKIYSLNKVIFSEPIIKAVNVFQGNDPASSTKQSADYSVRFSIAYDEEKNIYCLPYFRQRVTPMAFADEIIRSIKEEKPKRGHIESTNYQEMLRQYVREKLKEQNLSLPGLETKFNPRTEKSARLETLQPFFEQHKVFLKEDMKEFENELFTYPRSSHDDLIDGFYYSTRKLIQPHHLYQEEATDDMKYFLFYGQGSQSTAWLRS